eukprot:Phypoly_transcript_01490.p1 GENE.Phypoly_transcript_01490~~Phypoly_transcript_01490.p1  ORF type:complete len:1106 (-),score=253.34 Phypoly_transcript_01490:41-3337(-)
MRKILGRNKDESVKEVKARYDEFEEKKTNLKKFLDKFHDYIKKYHSTIEEGRELTDALNVYASTLPQGSVLATCIKEVAEMQKFFEDTVTDICAYSFKQLDEPLEQFIIRETENAQSVKKRYDKARSSVDSMQKDEGDQHARGIEIADEALEQFRQVDAGLDLHTLGFMSRYLSALHLMSTHLAIHSKQSVASIGQYSTNHFLNSVDQFEVETGRKFTTFNTNFTPSWAGNDIDRKPSSSGELSLQELRKKEISDLLKKERVYVDTLKSLVKIYLFEFRNNRQLTKIVTLEDLEDLFCNVEEILDLHNDFTWDLQSALDNIGNSSVATLLLDFIPKLEPYVRYIANSSKSADTLARLIKDKRYVANAIKQCSEKDRLGRSIQDLLQVPISHIRTYRAFAQQALDATPTSSSDYDPLDDALSMIMQLDDKVAIANQTASQFQTLLAISRRIDGGEELTTSQSRKLVKETSASTLESPVTLFLFSDLLVVCSTAAENENHTIKRKVALANVVNAVVAGGSTVQVEVQQEPPLAFSLPSYFEAQKWVDVLKETLQSLYNTKVFGVPLTDLMTKHEREMSNDIPSFIAEALDAIDATGLEVEGIFRVSGSVIQIRGVKETVNQGLPIDYRALDTHVVAGMVQNWIRELPEPLLTYGLYNEWIAHTSKGLEVGPVRATVAKLPQYHRFVLQYLCQFLNRVASFGKVNKMRSGNLAIVFGPSLLYERNATAAAAETQQEKDSTLVQFLSFASVHLRDVYTVVQFLIENQKEVFEGVEEERALFRSKLQGEHKAKQIAQIESRAEERKAIKARRMAEEREKAEIAAASDPELVRQAQERRQKREEERERQMLEEKEAKERERRRLEDEERAQQDEVRRQRLEAEEKKRIERQQKEVAEIEQRYADAQAKLQEEEDKVREIRKQNAIAEAERKVKQEAELKAREAARIREAQERAEREAREREEEARQERERVERERAEAKAREDAIPSCAACGLKVRDGVASKDKGLVWHRECYKCSECGTPIAGGVSLNGNLLVCAACSQKKKGGAVASGSGCGMCGKELSGRVVKVGDRRIHKACFKCEKCSGSLDDGFYEVDNKILCDNCSK